MEIILILMDTTCLFFVKFRKINRTGAGDSKMNPLHYKINSKPLTFNKYSFVVQDSLNPIMITELATNKLLHLATFIPSFPSQATFVKLSMNQIVRSTHQFFPTFSFLFASLLAKDESRLDLMLMHAQKVHKMKQIIVFF